MQVFIPFTMPEIKLKHVVSFSSEDKVHKAENLLKEETYRKWKCSSPGEKNATIVLQFEKATQIHSIDIGNEGSAFIEVLVGRSSDAVIDYQVLLVASSFMSPLESRNGTHSNRVRMFGPEKLSQNTKDEKWDCVQIVCTQPFNKSIQYGLTFIRFHSPPEKIKEQPNNEKPVTKLGAFKLKDDDDDEDSLPSLGSWFGKQKAKASESPSNSTSNQASPSYAAAILASKNRASEMRLQDNSLKRKAEEKNTVSEEPPTKKIPLNKNNIIYKDVLRGSPQNDKAVDSNKNVKKDAPSPKVKEKKKDAPSPKITEKKKDPPSTPTSSKPSANNTLARPSRQKVPFNKIMDKVVFVLSGFVNPLRSNLRDKALEMGAKYKPDWDATCTHLVCAFAKTPKYDQVKKLNGRIVTKEWIFDCYNKKEPLLYRKYALSSGDSSDEQDDSDKDPNFKAAAAADDDDDEEDSDITDIGDSDDEEKKKKKPKTFQRKRATRAADSPNKKKPLSPNVKNADISSNNNLSRTLTKNLSNISDSEEESEAPKMKNSPSIFNKLKGLQTNDVPDISQSSTVQKEDESETEDEDALQDYVADTDVEDDSGCDTEDEIRKAEDKLQTKKGKMNGMNKDLSEKPDVSDLPLPELPNFYKKKHFFLYGDFSPSKLHELQRYITAYNGNLEDYMSENVKYVITDKKWDSNFEDALSANEDLIFVKPTWIFKCHEAGKLVPYQPHIVIPDT